MARLEWLIARPIAHRGLHDAQRGIIENTASAFAAATAGNYGIECDVQISADGEAMVYHDEALGRLTDGSARIDAMTAAELKRVAFKATTERMITLGELCELVAGRATLVVELKSRHDGDRRLPARVAKVLSGYAGPAAAMSFDPAQIAALRAIAPRLTCGIVAQRHHRWRVRLSTAFTHAAAYSRDALRARPEFIAYAVNDLPAVFPSLARALWGLPVLTWTVRNADDCARAERWADQMIFEGFRP
jgi:glycerophosphoryl diester phosphodiesterase